MSGDYDVPPPDHLCDAHREQLHKSGISDEIIESAGLHTVTTAREAKLRGFGPKQAQDIPLPALCIPVYDVIGKVAYYRLRPDEPRTVNGDVRKYEQPAGKSVTLYVPPSVRESLRNPDVPLFITEGEKKALAAASRGLCCIGLMGVDCWKGTNERGGKTVLAEWNEVDLDGKRTYVTFDSDWLHKNAVAGAINRLYQWLKVRRAVPFVIQLPPLPNGEKCGLDDFLAQGKSVLDLVALAASELPDFRAIRKQQDLLKPPANGLPLIETTNRPMRDMTEDAMNALVAANDPPDMFVRGGQLVRVVTDEDCKPSAQMLNQDALRGILDRAAEFVSTSEKRGTISVFPPAAVVADVMARPSWPQLPALAGIVTAPVFAADGTLCDTPGYHAASRLFYYQSEGFSLPDTTPTTNNIAQALHLLRTELLGEFPFVDAASKANALALLLLPYVRFMIQGATPLHVIDAPAAGTGKGLLADACALAFAPQGLPIMTPCVKEEEWRKSILSTLLGAPTHILIDNARILDSASLDAVLTAPNTWTDRILGGSENATVPVRCVWVATSNNMVVKGDLPRRLIYIRLDSGEEKPYERAGFKKPNLRGWISENRAAIVGACLTLIRAWINAKRPDYAGSVRRGSYESWLSVIGGILETVGVSDFLGNVQAAESQIDNQLDAWRGFLSHWWNEFKSIRKEASAADLVPCANDYFPDELADERTRNQKMGNLLRSNVDRVFGEYRLRRLQDKQKTARYCVEEVKK
jgi:hypothetical protein